MRDKISVLLQKVFVTGFWSCTGFQNGRLLAFCGWLRGRRIRCPSGCWWNFVLLNWSEEISNLFIRHGWLSYLSPGCDRATLIFKVFQHDLTLKTPSRSSQWKYFVDNQRTADSVNRRSFTRARFFIRTKQLSITRLRCYNFFFYFDLHALKRNFLR